jgi:hypothetical protein
VQAEHGVGEGIGVGWGRVAQVDAIGVDRRYGVERLHRAAGTPAAALSDCRADPRPRLGYRIRGLHPPAVQYPPEPGYRFTLRGFPPGKGPYAWVSRHQAHAPAMNWEYLVQAAEYARVYAALSSKGFLVAVEDRLMDITVSDSDGKLLWYIEAEERAADVPAFVERLGRYGRTGVDLDAPDRNNDPLRKAKYVLRYRPQYLSVSSIGLRRDLQISYSAENRFALIDDMVPLA